MGCFSWVLFNFIFVFPPPCFSHGFCSWYDLQFVLVSNDYEFAHRMLLLIVGMFYGLLL